MSDKRKSCRRSIVNHRVAMRDRKGRFCKKSRMQKRQSRMQKRQSRMRKSSRSNGKYRGTLGDGCQLNTNTLGSTHSILSPGSDDTCYYRCPLTDENYDDLLCRNRLSRLAIAANDRSDPKVAVKNKAGDLIGEYMYEIPSKEKDAYPDHLKLAQLGGNTGWTTSFIKRGNKDLLKNTEKVLEMLKQKGATRRDGEELSVKNILQDYARINPNYKDDIEDLIKTL